MPLLALDGVIAVVSGDRTTYPQFAAHLMLVKTTKDTILHWEFAGGGALAGARNNHVRLALDRGAGWIWFIDDDHVFPPDVFGKLLRHDQDLVVPHVLQRRPPHAWVAMEPFAVSPDASDEDLIQAYGAHLVQPQMRPHHHGLVEIGAGGTGGMLISAGVLRAMPEPWFEFGRFGAASAGEDTWFCLKARRLGFEIFCDLDTPIGHLNTCAVWPTFDPATGLYAPTYKFGEHVERLPARAELGRAHFR